MHGKCFTSITNSAHNFYSSIPILKLQIQIIFICPYWEQSYFYILELIVLPVLFRPQQFLKQFLRAVQRPAAKRP